MGTMKLSKQIQELGSKKNVAIYANALSSCSAVGCGKFIHAHTLRNELWHDTFIGNILIGMYGRCGSIRDALFVFTKMPKRDVVSWNSMISRCSPWVLKKAPELLTQMQHDGVVPNKDLLRMGVLPRLLRSFFI